ncbi:MAG: hypothetical protein E7642_03550 [Ruminococcaceae bacterium]|nr:hypothetical protein [Oscillospiraceae bacterium]
MKYCLKLLCATLLLLALSFSSLVGCFGEIVDIGAEDGSERAEITDAPTEEQTEQPTEKKTEQPTEKLPDPEPVVEDRLSLLDGKSDAEKAIYLWDIQRQDILGVESYTMHTEAEIKGSYQGFPISAKVSGKTTASGIISKSKPFFREYMRMDMELNNGQYTESVITDEGYSGGMLYFCEEAAGIKNGVAAPCEYEEWLEYRRMLSDSSSPELLEDSCRNIAFEQTEEQIAMTLSGFSEDGLARIMSGFDSFTEFMGAPCIDVEVQLVYRKDLLPVDMSFEFVFDEGENAPEFSMRATLEDIGKTKAATVDFSGYKALRNLIELKKLELKLEEMKSASHGSFVYSYTESVSYDSDPDNALAEDEAELSVEYWNDDDGYRFIIEDALSGATVQYSNGILSISEDGEENITQACSDADAKAIIDAYIDPSDLNWGRTLSVTKNGNLIQSELNNVNLNTFGAYLVELGQTVPDLRKNYGYLWHDQRKNGSFSATYYANIAIYDEGEFYDLEHKALIDKVVYE